MKDIKIIVTKKVASVEGTPIIVCGNSDYTLSFTFDDEWSNEQNKVARFSFIKNGLKSFIDMPINDNTCQVPVLIGIGLVRVGAYAGDLKTTTGAKIKCHKSILCDDADTMDEPFKNLYENLKGEIAEAKEDTDKALADLEKGTIKSVSDIKLWELDTGYYYISGTCEVSKTEQVTYNKPHLYIVHKLFENQVRYIHLCADSQVMTWAPIEVGYSSNNSVGHKEYMLMDTSRLVTEINKYCRDDQFPSAKSVYDFVSTYVNEQLGVIDNGRY